MKEDCDWEWKGSPEGEKLVLRLHLREAHDGIVPTTEKIIKKLGLPSDTHIQECRITDSLWREKPK